MPRLRLPTMVPSRRFSNSAQDHRDDRREQRARPGIRRDARVVGRKDPRDPGERGRDEEDDVAGPIDVHADHGGEGAVVGEPADGETGLGPVEPEIEDPVDHDDEGENEKIEGPERHRAIGHDLERRRARDRDHALGEHEESGIDDQSDAKRRDEDAEQPAAPAHDRKVDGLVDGEAEERGERHRERGARERAEPVHAVEEEEEIAGGDEDGAVRDVEDAQGREDERKTDRDQRVIAGDAQADDQHLRRVGHRLWGRRRMPASPRA